MLYHLIAHFDAFKNGIAIVLHINFTGFDAPQIAVFLRLVFFHDIDKTLSTNDLPLHWNHNAQFLVPDNAGTYAHRVYHPHCQSAFTKMAWASN